MRQRDRTVGLLIVTTIFVVSFGSLGLLIYRSVYGNYHGLWIWIAFAAFELIVFLVLVLLPGRSRTTKHRTGSGKE